MAKPTDMVIPMLSEMRAENEARHREVLVRFDRVEQRLKKLEDAQVSFKQALTANSLFSKQFEERIEVRELESRQ